MDALKNLLDNEKGLVAVVILLAATGLFALHDLSVDDWKSMMQWIFGIYAGSTALHQTAAAFANGKSNGDSK